MLRGVLVAVAVVCAAAVMSAQRGGGRGGGGGTSHYPTAEQWAAMPAKAKEYVDRAKALAGNDPDLQFDFGIFCAAGGGASNQERATIGVPNSEPKLTPFPAPMSRRFRLRFFAQRALITTWNLPPGGRCEREHR